MKLITKIVGIKKEKEKLAVDLEKEEEFITNNLHRHMSVLRNEKKLMEDEVNDLKRQIHEMQRQKEKVRILIYRIYR
jgi:coiled-coil domain-containing protein 6